MAQIFKDLADDVKAQYLLKVHGYEMQMPTVPQQKVDIDRAEAEAEGAVTSDYQTCLLYTSPSPRDS